MFRLSEFSKPRRIEMTENQVLALKGRRVEITCLAGLVWITDGVSGDRVIKSGQQAALRSKSRICVQAFAPSAVRIRHSAPPAYAGWQHARRLWAGYAKASAKVTGWS